MATAHIVSICVHVGAILYHSCWKHPTAGVSVPSFLSAFHLGVSSSSTMCDGSINFHPLPAFKAGVTLGDKGPFLLAALWPLAPTRVKCLP